MPNSTAVTWPAISELIPVVVFVGIAACIYMIAGFGFALFAVPSISLFMPVTEAVALLSLLGLTSVLRQSFSLREHIDRPRAVRFSVWAVAGMPVGYWIVNVISDQALRIFLGVSTIIATVVLLRRSENHTSHPAVENLFAFASGALNVSIGTNGSPLVFALQGRRLSPNQFRATIAVIFAVSAVATTTIFAIDGRYTSRILLLAVSALPSWLIGTLTGRNVAGEINQQQFRSVVLLLLAITGISTLVFAL
jgi:uncharacterized membrane protein YfcA